MTIQTRTCTLVLAPLALAAVALSPGDALAQSTCDLTTDSSPLGWLHIPTRSPAYRNGFLSVKAEQHVGGDLQKYASVENTFTPLPTQRNFTVSSNVDLTDAFAGLTGLGGGEAGIRVSIEAFVGGVRQCVEDRTLYIARFNEEHTEPNGPITPPLSCNFSRSGAASSVRVKVTFHAWATVGGFARALTRLSGYVRNMSVNGCTNSCSGQCGGSANGCFCDSYCVTAGDCCGDYAPRCNGSSCWGSCGTSAPSGSCWCDPSCTSYGDCCTDYATVCE